MSLELKPCPSCAYSSSLTPFGTVRCQNSTCLLDGPLDDDGSKWNALPRHTPGTVEVPVSELEALRAAHRDHAFVLRGTRAPEHTALLVAAANLFAHLPSKPDHVAKFKAFLRGEYVSGGMAPTFEAALAALEAQERKGSEVPR